MSELAHLLAPVDVGPLTLRNRVVSTSHQTGLVHDHLPTEDLLDYHEARARGGAGAIFVEATAVDPTGLLTGHTIAGFHPEIVPVYERLADRVHGHGAKLFVQLLHGGRELIASSPKPPAVAPSAVPSLRFKSEPRALTLNEIKNIIAGYGDSARLAAEGGLDGIEVSMAHGYLPAQFLSPLSNRRGDSYDGSLEARLRFSLEVLGAVRAAIGDHLAVSVRLSADELTPGGLDLEQSAQIAARLHREGGVDLISLVLGHSAFPAASTFIAPPPPVPANAIALPAKAIRDAVPEATLLTTTRVVDLAAADELVADGIADLVGMTRALIADPDLVDKTRAGRTDEVIECVGCNQACIGHYHAGVPIGCAVNPRTGRERTLPRRHRSPQGRVLIIGGGPAGCAAALEAAGEDVQVTLLEREPELGGQLRLAGHAPAHAETWERYHRSTTARLSAAGVDVQLNTEATADTARDYDRVVLATGARPYTPPDAPPAVQAWDVIRAPEPIAATGPDRRLGRRLGRSRCRRAPGRRRRPGHLGLRRDRPRRDASPVPAQPLSGTSGRARDRDPPPPRARRHQPAPRVLGPHRPAAGGDHARARPGSRSRRRAVGPARVAPGRGPRRRRARPAHARGGGARRYSRGRERRMTASGTATTRIGGHLVAESLAALGAEAAFGVPGVHALAIWEGLRAGPVTAYGTRTELCAGFAADGYARSSGKPAPLLLSTGPGALNSLTAIMEAASSHVPVVAVSSQIPAPLIGAGRGYLHELPDQLASFRPLVKHAVRARSADAIPELLARAWQVAVTPPSGPVYVEIPVDLLRADVGGSPVTALAAAPQRHAARADALQVAAGLLDEAQRPVIWAGGGVVRSGAEDELRALAERLDAPVATTYMGKGAFPGDHRLAAGCGCDEAALQELLGDADVLLCAGTELGAETTGQYELKLGGRLIHLDADPARIGLTYAATPLIGDAKPTLAALTPLVSPRAPADAAERVAAVHARIRRGLEDQGREFELGLLDTVADRAARRRHHRLGHDHPRLLGRPPPAARPRPAVPVSAGLGNPGLRLAGGDRRRHRQPRPAGAGRRRRRRPAVRPGRARDRRPTRDRRQAAGGRRRRLRHPARVSARRLRPHHLGRAAGRRHRSGGAGLRRARRHRHARRSRRAARMGAGAAGAGRRRAARQAGRRPAHAMTAPALPDLLRPSVIGVGAYVPGASASETKARFGRQDMVRLNWNENLFGPLPGVLEETSAALGSAWAYPEEAYAELRGALASWSGADPRQLVLGHGIQALTVALVTAFVDPGDAVVIPRPTYGLYAQACAVAGARVHRVDNQPSLALDLEAVARTAADTGAKLAWICDPNNPTGLRLRASEWEEFLTALPDTCVAVVDEAYGDYIEPGRRLDRLADIRAGRPLIVLRTFSKIFGLAGLRLGYLLADESLTAHLDAVQEPFNVNCSALAAGLASLRRTDLLPARRAQVDRARRRLTARLAPHGIRAYESDANFVLLELGDDDLRVADALARGGVLVRAGTEFGLPGFIRVTTGDEELMDSVGAQIASAVSR